MLQTVTGSPFGTNFFRIDGPNIGGPGVDTIQVNNWTLAGQLAAGRTIVTHIASGDFKNDGTGDIAAVDAAGAVWFIVAAGIWGQVTNPVGVSFLNGKLITGDFNNARLGDEIVRLREALGLIRGSTLADGTAGELRRIAEEALK